MKTCSRCGESKLIDDFYFADASKNRRFSYCKVCHKASSKAWAHRNREQRRHLQRKSETARRLRQRRAVLDAYGRECACCGEAMEVVLDIDHIDGGGNEHRKEVSSGMFYDWLIRNDFPDGFQVLCRNCNWAKYRLGQCPHMAQVRSI